MVREISTLSDLDAEISNSKYKDKLILVDFFATYVKFISSIDMWIIFLRWCGPCLRIAPKIEDWNTGEFKDKVVFIKCDVDQDSNVSEKYKVEAMPTFVFFKNGKEIHRLVGANVDQLKSDIESRR